MTAKHVKVWFQNNINYLGLDAPYVNTRKSIYIYIYIYIYTAHYIYCFAEGCQIYLYDTPFPCNEITAPLNTCTLSVACGSMVFLFFLAFNDDKNYVKHCIDDNSTKVCKYKVVQI